MQYSEKNVVNLLHKSFALVTFDVDVYVKSVVVAVVKINHVWQNVSIYRVMCRVLLVNDSQQIAI